jgi:hypothetical protein
MKTLAAAVGLVVVLASPLAFAQGQGHSANPPVTRYDENVWGTTTVEGTTHSGLGELAAGLVRDRSGSLLRVRTHFHPELLKSVENL